MNHNIQHNHHESSELTFNKGKVALLAGTLATTLAVSVGVPAAKWTTHKEKIATGTVAYHEHPNGDISLLEDGTQQIIEEENLGINTDSISGIVYEGQTIHDEIEKTGDNSVTIDLYKSRLGNISMKATPTSEIESDK